MFMYPSLSVWWRLDKAKDRHYRHYCLLASLLSTLLNGDIRRMKCCWSHSWSPSTRLSLWWPARHVRTLICSPTSPWSTEVGDEVDSWRLISYLVTFNFSFKSIAPVCDVWPSINDRQSWSLNRLQWLMVMLNSWMLKLDRWKLMLHSQKLELYWWKTKLYWWILKLLWWN